MSYNSINCEGSNQEIISKSKPSISKCMCGNKSASAYSNENDDASSTSSQTTPTPGRCSSCASVVNFNSSYDHLAKGNSLAQICRYNSLTQPKGCRTSLPKAKPVTNTSDLSYTNDLEYWGITNCNHEKKVDDNSLKSLISVTSLFSNYDTDFKDYINPENMPLKKYSCISQPIPDCTNDISRGPSYHGSNSKLIEKKVSDYCDNKDFNASFNDIIDNKYFAKRNSSKISPKSTKGVGKIKKRPYKRSRRTCTMTKSRGSIRSRSTLSRNTSFNSKSLSAQCGSNKRLTCNGAVRSKSSNSRTCKSRSSNTRKIKNTARKSKSQVTKSVKSRTRSPRKSRSAYKSSSRSRTSTKSTNRSGSRRVNSKTPIKSILKSRTCIPCVKYNRPHPNAFKKECRQKKSVTFKSKKLNQRK